MEIKKIGFLTLSVFVYTQQIIPIDINHLKDTYSILKDEYKYLSPVHGAIWMETQILKNYYKSGDPKSSTIILIKELFNLIEDAFGVTRNVGMPAHYFSPEIIASIIGTIEKCTVEDRKNLSKKIQGLICVHPDFVQKAQGELKEKWDDENQQRILRQRIEKLSKAIIKSLEECGFWGESKYGRIYPPYTTHAILLGFLYKLANDKKDLSAYFNTLSSVAEKDIFTSSGRAIFTQKSWESSCFNKGEVDTILKASSKHSSKDLLTPFLSAVKQELGNKQDPFEAIVFAEITRQFYSRSLPSVIGNRKEHIRFNGRPFADCVEIASRNLCNFITFNQEELKFIPIKSGNLNPSQDLIKYYQGDCADATMHLRSDMYQIWGDLLQNVPGFIYAAMSSKINPGERYERLLGKDIFNSSKAKPCFILLSKEDMKKVGIENPKDQNNVKFGKEPYVVADPASYNVYALWPSLKNIIILMNHLFGLKLYDDPLAPFKDLQFCSKYFPLMCDKLGWGYKLPPYFNLDKEYFNWFDTIPMYLIKDTSVSWDFFVKWHHVEVVHPQSPIISKVTKEYKEKLFKKLLENKETIESYGLLALYAPNSNVLEAFKLAGFKIEGELEFLLKLKQLKKNLDSLKKKLMFLQGKIGHLKDMLKNED